jgi:apoptosis-inducing factor 2
MGSLGKLLSYQMDLSSPNFFPFSVLKMALDKLRLFIAVFKYLIPYGFKRTYQLLQASYHRWTYESLAHTQNVVVVGGSFAGLSLAKRLCETLPTGYKVILIERNSHFNFSWVFPRFSVIPGYEEQAFIPYDGVARNAPAGIWSHIHDSVVQITPTEVHLASGEKIIYAFLAIATGSSQPAPAKTVSTDSQEAGAELRTFQQAIQDAKRIAVVGGGAVGIEISSDIKSYFPEKDITLFHSRQQLLSAFGPRLHRYVMEAFEELGIHVVRGERPEILPGLRSHYVL